MVDLVAITLDEKADISGEQTTPALHLLCLKLHLLLQKTEYGLHVVLIGTSQPPHYTLRTLLSDSENGRKCWIY